VFPGHTPEVRCTLGIEHKYAYTYKLFRLMSRTEQSHVLHGAQLAELAVFVAVARLGSFRKAAHLRDVAPSAISHAIRSLEERLNVRLFNRTTRSVSLTDAGQKLLNDLDPAFGQISQAMQGLEQFRAAPFGVLRITAPASVAPLVFHGVMAPLLAENPQLQLDIRATDALVDIVKEGFDAGIRLGERLSQDMIAVRIKPRLRMAVVGSPRYFKSRKPPRSPTELRDHLCIRYRFPSGAIYDWEFERSNEKLEVQTPGPLTVDSQELMVEAALQGCGLAYVWDARVQAYLASGTLVRCLDDWCSYEDLYLYYPSHRHVSAGLRALLESLKGEPMKRKSHHRASN
jgi:DNA-binding transcriptional LysR family regulator